MRIVHTSDWHLGHSLHRYERAREHEAFLDWLREQLADHAVDALLIAGDIFDTVNPSADAQRQWYRFLARLRTRMPAIDIVVIGGNHDSAGRLDAPNPLLDELGIVVVGGARRTGRTLHPEEMVCALKNAHGEVAAQVAAVPFLRMGDLPPTDTEGDRAVEGVRAAYRAVLDVARARQEPGQALIAMGHCYMTGTALSELSERKILGGNQHALPVELFPEDVDYVALGHLHLAQAVGSEHVRYSGSPIPLSLPERTYPHQVVMVDFEAGRIREITPIRIPRTVDLIRVPKTGVAPLGEVLRELRMLAEVPPGDEDRGLWPYLEVHISLPEPEPTLRAQVEEALARKRVRLAKIRPSYTGTGLALGDHADARDLSERGAEEVFAACWSAKHTEPPSERVMACFHTLVAQVRAGGEG